jgi:uncharacterized membrane protein
MLKIRTATITLQQSLPYLFVIAGILGSLASFVLTYDKIQVLQNPGYNPPCNINPVLSCGSVMRTEQASLLGVPNTIFGLVAFTMLFTLGAILVAGVKLPKWMWVAAQFMATAGVIFMHYLFFQGVYRINAICPWCFMVWMITIPVFWYTTLYNLRNGMIALRGRMAAVAEFMQRHHGNILIVWYLVILVIILHRFWYYWSTLL